MKRKLWKDALLGIGIMGVAAMLEFHWPPLHYDTTIDAHDFITTGTGPQTFTWTTSTPGSTSIIAFSYCAGGTMMDHYGELSAALKTRDSKELAKWCLNGQPLAFAKKKAVSK